MWSFFRMERDRGFNFKLLVPPRVNAGQVSAVRPQEAVGKCADIMDTLQHVSWMSQLFYGCISESSGGKKHIEAGSGVTQTFSKNNRPTSCQSKKFLNHCFPCCKLKALMYGVSGEVCYEAVIINANYDNCWFSQGYSMCFDKGPFPNTSMVPLTKPTRQGILYYTTLAT